MVGSNPTVDEKNKKSVRNFDPAIQINDCCDHRISFNVFEWFEFTKTLIHIIEEEEKEKEITTQFWGNFTINVIPIT
jgi:hypothetical protein